ncbi:protein translocase subunit SecF [soil metagenome]
MSFLGRMYRAELNYAFIGRRQRWYAISAVILVICIGSMIFRGFNFGIEFEGGNSFQLPGSEQQVEQAEEAASATGVEVVSVQVVGQDSLLLRTPELDNETAAQVTSALATALDLDAADISNSAVSARWGGDITTKALQALVVFLVAVMVFIALRFQPKMAVAAILGLFNDLVLSAGVYSLIGFEVTPATVIGLLTILGFSLSDTVVVFDKVDENTRGILGGARTTYSEAANLAINQTLMRSINTSLIALLPVAGLLFVGAGLLGAGTLKDLALVLFVGIATGAYSSIFLATPILCDLKEREPQFIALRKRVQAKRSSARKEAEGTRSDTQAATSTAEVDEPAEEDELVGATAAPPRPGAKPTRSTPAKSAAAKAASKPRPGGKPQTRRSGGRPSGKRKR